jgi:hypothetical protein
MVTVSRIYIAVGSGSAAGNKEGETMRIRRGVMAAGVAIGSIGLPIATAGTASAHGPTVPYVTGVITGLHTFVIAPYEVVVVGETLHPQAPGYTADVPVTAVTTWRGVTTVTTGYTFLPLNRVHKVTTFRVVPPLPWPPM